MLSRIALLAMLSLCQIAAEDQKIIIIKADDVISKWDMSAYQKFIDVSKSKGVKVSLGIECYTFAGACPPFLEFLRTNRNLKDVEYWHHGWNTSACYSGTGYDYQKKIFTDSEKIMHEVIGDWPVAMGPPGNAYDADTVRIMNESPHMRMFFSYNRPEGLNADKVSVTIVKGEPKNPNGNDYNVYSEKVLRTLSWRSGAVALQFHPGSFVSHDGLEDIIEYGKILDHLKATGWTFMLPSEYIASLDPQPLPLIPVITTTALANGTVGRSYSQTLAGTNSPTSWSITSGSLPAGVTLNADTGRLSGIPRAAGIKTFTVAAQNAAGTSSGKTLRMTIVAAPTANRPPTVSFKTPQSGAVLAAGSDLRVEVLAADGDGSVANVKLYVNNVFIREECNAPYTWSKDAPLLDLAEGTYRIKAIATDNDGATSTAVETVTVTAPTTTRSGLRAEFFDYSSALSTLPNLVGRIPTVTRTDAQINYRNVHTAWTGLPSSMADTFASRHTGQIRIATAGRYTFYLNSDDGSKLWLDDTLLINNDGLHEMVEKSGTMTLTAGVHALRVEFFENEGTAGLVMSWAGPGIAKQVVPANVLLKPASSYASLPVTTGLAWWLDASQLTGLGNGQQVTAWTDASGLGNHALYQDGSGTGYPRFTTNALNDLPTVLFNSSANNCGDSFVFSRITNIRTVF